MTTLKNDLTQWELIALSEIMSYYNHQLTFQEAFPIIASWKPVTPSRYKNIKREHSTAVIESVRTN